MIRGGMMLLKDMVITNRNLKINIIYQNKADPIITFNLHTYSFINAITRNVKDCEIVHIHISNTCISIYIKEV